MSSAYVRNQIKTFLAVNFPTEKVVDLTAQYGEIRKVLEQSGITTPGPWIGLQFVGSQETPITLSTSPTQGKFREQGIVYLHIVDVAKLNVGDLLLDRSEDLRSAFRSARIGRIIVESVTPPNFEEGSTLQFEGGYTTASILIGYQYDLDL